jgi:protein-disulfide isomerase
MKNPWIIVGIITIALIAGSVWYSNVASERNNEGVVTGTQHLKGNPEAAVTLVEYSDFQCPACAAFQPVINDLMTTYGDRVRFEYKHFPLSAIHPYAEQAARAAEAAGQQGKFFEYHDALFENQATWSRSPNPSAFFLTYAEELGLDMDTFARQMRSTALRDEVRKDAAEARQLGISGTPTFFLNGNLMQFSTFEEFVAQVAAVADPAAAANTATTTEGSAPPVRFGI